MENEEQNFTDPSDVPVTDNDALPKVPFGQAPPSNEVEEIFQNTSGKGSNKILVVGVFLMIVSILAFIVTIIRSQF